MKKHDRLFCTSTCLLALLSIVFLLVVMIGMLLYRQGIIMFGSAFTHVNILLLAGFAVIVLFDGFSLLWNISQMFMFGIDEYATNQHLLIAGVLCCVLFAVGVNSLNGLGAQPGIVGNGLGKLLLLYIFLVIQLAYAVVMYIHISRFTRHDGMADTQ